MSEASKLYFLLCKMPFKLVSLWVHPASDEPTVAVFIQLYWFF